VEDKTIVIAETNSFLDIFILYWM